MVAVGGRIRRLRIVVTGQDHRTGLQDGPRDLAAVGQELAHAQLAAAHHVVGGHGRVQQLVAGEGHQAPRRLETFHEAGARGEEVGAAPEDEFAVHRRSSR